MVKLCQYSESLGIPSKGAHQYKIFNIAIFDVVLTIIVAFIAYYSINKIFGLHISFFIYLLILFIIGIISHRVFCVRTTVDKILFN